MDGRNISLAAFVCLGLLAVGGFLYVLNRSAEQTRRQAEEAARLADEEARRETVRVAALGDRLSRPDRDVSRRLESLQKLLRSRSAELRRKNAEYRELQAKFDQTLETVEQLMAQRADGGETAKSAGNGKKPPATAGGEGAVDVDQEVARLLDRQRREELEQLRAELNRANEDLAAVLVETESQIAALLDENEALQQAAAQMLIGTGSSAVPALAAALGHARPEVRRWAALVLGRLGGEARRAIPELTTALEDADPGVREAAREALRMIDQAEQR